MSAVGLPKLSFWALGRGVQPVALGGAGGPAGDRQRGAVGFDNDGTVGVGSKDLDAGLAQALYHVRSWVVETPPWLVLVFPSEFAWMADSLIFDRTNGRLNMRASSRGRKAKITVTLSSDVIRRLDALVETPDARSRGR